MVKIKRADKYFTYIVECSDKTYYTGYTNDLEKRIKRHNQGLASKCTRARLPVRLVWCKEYKYYKNALRAERNLKKLSHAQKDNLVKIYEENNS